MIKIKINTCDGSSLVTDFPKYNKSKHILKAVIDSGSRITIFTIMNTSMIGLTSF